jgi:PiT family inorganic phosphate transporter
MLSIIFWGSIAAKLGLPVSKSHSLLSGLAGAGFAGSGLAALQWEGWLKVAIGMASSIVMGISCAWLIARLIIRYFGGSSPGPAKRRFDNLQVLSASFMAFNHGLNDGQKFIGVFALTLLAGGITREFTIPYWVILICAFTMGLGTTFGGWRIIETIGSRMTRIVSWQGFAAETSASLTILGASTYGIPLSTTHTITSSIVGVGAGKRAMDVRWGVLRRIVTAWLVTFPFCAMIAYCAALVANYFWA